LHGKNKGARILITLECTECRFNPSKRSNGVSRYHSQKNRRNNPQRMELKNIVHIAINPQFTKKSNKLCQLKNKKY
jgi:ribosomal protein L33, bacterial type